MSRRGTNIRKRTDGRWEGRYYIVDTAGSKKCKSVYGHSYKEVTERLLTAKAASLNQTAAPKQSAITVKAVAEKWLESIASSRKCSTIQKYSTIYNKYIKPNWGESVIDELNQNEILKELPETAGESVTKSILCIFNSILAYGAATYGTGEIHLSYRAKRSSVTSSNNINTINTTDQQKLTEYLLTELDIYKLGILLCLFMGLRLGDDDDKIRLNQRKPSKYKGLSRFGPEKNLQRINKFMKERPTFYKKLIQMKENFRFYLRCFYCITKVVILQFNSEKQDRISS